MQVVDGLQIPQVDIGEGGVGELMRVLMQRGQLLFQRLRALKIGHAVLQSHPLADGLLHAEMHVVRDLTDQPVKHDEDEQHDAGLKDHVVPVDLKRPIHRQRGHAEAAQHDERHAAEAHVLVVSGGVFAPKNGHHRADGERHQHVRDGQHIDQADAEGEPRDALRQRVGGKEQGADPQYAAQARVDGVGDKMEHGHAHQHEGEEGHHAPARDVAAVDLQQAGIRPAPQAAQQQEDGRIQKAAFRQALMPHIHERDEGEQADGEHEERQHRRNGQAAQVVAGDGGSRSDHRGAQAHVRARIGEAQAKRRAARLLRQEYLRPELAHHLPVARERGRLVAVEQLVPQPDFKPVLNAPRGEHAARVRRRQRVGAEGDGRIAAEDVRQLDADPLAVLDAIPAAHGGQRGQIALIGYALDAEREDDHHAESQRNQNRFGRVRKRTFFHGDAPLYPEKRRTQNRTSAIYNDPLLF